MAAKRPNPFAKGGAMAKTPKGQTKAVAAKGFMPGKKGVNPFAKTKK